MAISHINGTLLIVCFILFRWLSSVSIHLVAIFLIIIFPQPVCACVVIIIIIIIIIGFPVQLPFMTPKWKGTKKDRR